MTTVFISIHYVFNKYILVMDAHEIKNGLYFEFERKIESLVKQSKIVVFFSSLHFVVNGRLNFIRLKQIQTGGTDIILEMYLFFTGCNTTKYF